MSAQTIDPSRIISQSEFKKHISKYMKSLKENIYISVRGKIVAQISPVNFKSLNEEI